MPPRAAPVSKPPVARRYVWGVVGAILGVCALVAWSSAMRASAAPTSLARASGGENNDVSVCSEAGYSSTTLKTVKDMSALALFHDLKGQKKFEASGLTRVGDFFYLVFDNLYSIGRVKEHMPYNSRENTLVGSPGKNSGFESIFYDKEKDLFFVTQESVDNGEGEFHAIVQELQLTEGKDDYTKVRECPSEFTFESGNKGFEGTAPVRRDGKLYVLALCEGNDCKAGKAGRTPGRGKIVVMEQSEEGEKGCEWKTVTTIQIPPSANFVDYSSIALRGNKVAIASQESSRLWVGTLSDKEWLLEGGNVLNFPRNDACEIVYCNIEGVTWLSDTLLAAVSDKMKGNGKQPARCLSKDQGMHVFVMP